MSNEKPNAIWTPDGLKTIGLKLDRIELRAGVMEWFRQFSDVAAALGLGVHCAQCNGDVMGKNSDSDRVYSFACGCREFIGPNREYRPPTAH